MPEAIYVISDGQQLKPASQIDLEQLQKLPVGRELEITVKRKRSLAHHRLYWVILTWVSNNLPDPPEGMSHWPFDGDKEALHDELKWQCGLVERKVHADGRHHWQVRSIALEKMDQIEFSRYFDRAMQWLSMTFYDGEDLIRMVDLDGKLPEVHFEAIATVGKVRIVFEMAKRAHRWRVMRIARKQNARGIDFAGIVGAEFKSVEDAIKAFQRRIRERAQEIQKIGPSGNPA